MERDEFIIGPGPEPTLWEGLSDGKVATARWDDSSFKAQLGLAQKLLWMIDEFSLADGSLSITGWFFCHFHPHENTRFLINGKHVVKPDELWLDESLEQIWTAIPQAARRFRMAATVQLNEGPFYSIELLPSGSISDKGSEASSWSIFDPACETDAFPPVDNIYRVIANRTTATYQLGGATVAKRLDAYLRRLTGRSIAEIGPILDWGCGCARVSRYLRKLGCTELVGADVDSANVSWCQQNVPWLDARLIDSNPPMPFAREQFSLVIGISIFTHLREHAQFAWLNELARVLKPGGMAIVTVMTSHQLALQQSDRETIDRLNALGFLVTEDNDQIQIGEGVNDYVNTYHSEAYIHKKWGNALEQVEIVPFLGAHQDAVVLRKPY